MSNMSKSASALAGSQAAGITRTAFSTSRLLDFCSEKELTNLTAHAPHEWPLVVVKELVDNALDACEGAGIVPVVEIVVDDAGITVADNGPGIPPGTVKALLNYDDRTSSREAYVSLTRGAQGNALQTIFAMPFVLQGERGRVRIEAAGYRHAIEFGADHIQRKPVITHVADAANVKSGTLFWVEWPLSPRSKLEDAATQFLQVVSNFAWMNPHLTLSLNWFGSVTAFEPSDTTWIKWRPSDPSPPHWYEAEHLERLISAYLSADRTRGKERTVREFIEEFRGLSGTAKHSAVLGATGLKGAPLSRLTKGNGFDKPLINGLLTAMREAGKDVKPAALGIIGEDHIRQRFEDAGCEMETFQYKKLLLTDGLPTVVEAAFGWCPGQQGRVLVTGVNWSPGIRNAFQTLDGESLDDLLADQWAHPREAATVFLHVSRPRIQYTDRGKSRIVLPRTTAGEIANAMKRLTDKWAKERRATEKKFDAEDRFRERMLRKQNSKLSQKDAAWHVMEAAYLKASDNGRLPALARQIMYAARPHILAATGKETFDDRYFTQTLLPDYVEQNNCDWNVVYDARGHFHEPHTGRGVPLGTLSIRNYLDAIGKHTVREAPYDVREALYPTHGAKNRFGAVMFIEKEGFMPLFKAVGLAERYDLAIMSTKGMSVTASRKLVDTICADGSIPLLVVHDFDKSGFSIAGTLQRSTRRYAFDNDIRVIDLGMRIDDIDGLPQEASGIEQKEMPAARLNLAENGATRDEIEFLLKQRVELNAFTSDAFVAWIEKKLAQHGVKKVVPDDATLAAAYARAREQHDIQVMITEAVKKRRVASVDTAPSDIRATIEATLRDDPTLTWDEVVADIAAAADA